MRSDLLNVVAALHLSNSIFNVIRRNLVWACIYNVIGIPLAMGVFLPWGLHLHPMMAGAAMAFSSVSVVTSSLTLRWWKRPQSSVMPGEIVPGPTDVGERKGSCRGCLGIVQGEYKRTQGRDGGVQSGTFGGGRTDSVIG